MLGPVDCSYGKKEVDWYHEVCVCKHFFFFLRMLKIPPVKVNDYSMVIFGALMICYSFSSLSK